MNPFNLVLAIVVAILLLALVETVLGLLRHAHTIRTASSIHLEDLTALNLTPPDVTAPIIRALAGLGFRPVGQAGRKPPASPQLWYFVDPGGTTCAGVFDIGGQGYATIYSWFGEEAVSVTVYPTQEPRIEQRDYRHVPVMSSVEDAYRRHLAGLDDFKMRYGSPTKLDRIDAVIRYDNVFNRRFAPRRMRPPMVRGFVRLAAILVVGVAVAIILIVRR